MGLKRLGKPSGQDGASVVRGIKFPPSLRPNAAKASQFPYPLLVGPHALQHDPLKGWMRGTSLKIPWGTGREHHECGPELPKPTNWAEEEAWDVWMAEREVEDAMMSLDNPDWNMWRSVIYGGATTALPPPPAPAADAPNLPPPWVAMIDRERNHTPFYVNHAAGISQWQHPFPAMLSLQPTLPRASDGGCGEWWPGGTKPSAAELCSVAPLLAVMISRLGTQDSPEGVLNVT